MTATATIHGGEQVIARFEKIGAGVRERMIAVMQTAASSIQQQVVQNKLSGQVLKVRTGDLRRSITAITREGSASSISAVVGAGANVPYAAIHEYGGTVNVPAHMRMLTMVFGRVIATPHPIQVRAHSATYPERSFLRTSLRDKAPEEIQHIRDAMNQLIAETHA